MHSAKKGWGGGRGSVVLHIVCIYAIVTAGGGRGDQYLAYIPGRTMGGGG
jgi:hypothetical protein